MSIRKYLVSLSALGLALVVSTAVVNAQEVTSTDKVEKVEKRERGFGHGDKGRGFGRKHGKFGRHGMGMRGMFRGIELTEAQKAQFKAIREANKPSAELREEMRAIMIAKRDGTITEAQKARMESFRADHKAKAESIKAQIDAILTPEQKQQIETRKVEMKQRKEEFRKQRELRKQQQPSETVKTTKDN
ncbi:MAG TPA: Spy/CpxP family protein refolding chaperone [Pyrinomonadaceae bacterium]|nr:Spy/CpxP family protein refolding chaperone [Pyrinomonadaceae bacterium]